MVQSKLTVVTVKILNLRLGYKRQGLKLGKFYHVICYDMKRLIIAGEEADRAYTVKWADAELVKSEITFARNRPDTALLNEMQLLRRAMGKLSTAVPKLKILKESVLGHEPPKPPAPSGNAG
jgi:hypothetical protein